MRPTGRSRGNEPPVLLVKWYDVTKRLLERVDSFPKNQRFIFGLRIGRVALTGVPLLLSSALSQRQSRHTALEQCSWSGEQAAGSAALILIWRGLRGAGHVSRLESA